MMRLLAIFALALVTGGVTAQELFPLSIIHINDFHARFSDVNEEGFTCLTGENCLGGYSRIISTVRSLQEEAENSLYVNAGGTFKGTLWYTVHRWPVMTAMMNVLPADAMTLGRFDFFDGIAGLAPFMAASETPIVLANVNATDEPDFVDFTPSIVVERSGRQIGIIGVIMQTVDAVGDPGRLRFTDPAEAIREEAERLNGQGVDIIVVLSYNGFNREREFARECGPYVDIIVGAQSNTVLYNGDSSGFPLEVEGEYPTVEFQPDGRRVLVVQAGSYSRLVGHITLFFDEDGEIQEWEGNPIFLAGTVQQDADTMEALLPWREDVEAIGNRTVGILEVPLARIDCERGECALGSFITDAMENAVFPVFNGIAFKNRGAIRADLPAGPIAYKQLFELMPFENHLITLTLRGDQIMNILEFSVRNAYVTNGTVVARNLLQVAGMRVVFRLANPPYRRLQSAEVLCQQCTGQVFEPINPFREYRVVVSDFLADGGDGFDGFVENGLEAEVGPVDLDTLDAHFDRLSPVGPVTDGRISFVL